MNLIPETSQASGRRTSSLRHPHGEARADAEPVHVVVRVDALDGATVEEEPSGSARPRHLVPLVRQGEMPCADEGTDLIGGQSQSRRDGARREEVEPVAVDADLHRRLATAEQRVDGARSGALSPLGQDTGQPRGRRPGRSVEAARHVSCGRSIRPSFHPYVEGTMKPAFTRGARFGDNVPVTAARRCALVEETVAPTLRCGLETGQEPLVEGHVGVVGRVPAEEIKTRRSPPRKPCSTPLRHPSRFVGANGRDDRGRDQVHVGGELADRTEEHRGPRLRRVAGLIHELRARSIRAGSRRDEPRDRDPLACGGRRDGNAIHEEDRGTPATVPGFQVTSPVPPTAGWPMTVPWDTCGLPW